MKLRKAIVCLSMCLAIGSSAAAPMASEAKSLEPKSEAKVSVKNQKNSKSGWVKRGKNRYYRMKNGKLCKSKYKKIGKYYYSFDSKGRMKTGLVKVNDKFSGYFSRKTGRLAYCVMDLKVKRVYKGSAVGQRKSGKSYELYDIPLTKVKLVNSKGKRIKASAVKKNDLVRICFNGDILERYPAAFQEIVKIKLL